MTGSSASDGAPVERATVGRAAPGRRVVDMLDRRVRWVEALLALAVLAAGFAVLGFAARYVEDYFRIILIFILAWLLAFLISPLADFLQRHLTRLPRTLAVMAVVVPILVLAVVVTVKVVATIADSLAQLVAALPGLAVRPPAFILDLQARLDGAGVDIDLVGAFRSGITQILAGAADLVLGLVNGIASLAGTAIDAIIVISIAIYMAIDRDRILRFGLDLTPPDHREGALLFRQRVVSAFGGFFRSQLVLGALYGIWALVVSFVLGLPFGLATAVLAGLIMAIPIYGPYVSWLPPVAVALLVDPSLALPAAVLMLIGWFIDENILAPLVRAGALQMNPIVVMFAFLLGAQLAGAIGAMLGIPVAAVIQAFVMESIDRVRTERGWPTTDAQLDVGPSAGASVMATHPEHPSS